MAKNETVIGTTPERVFAVLSDPNCYGDWVVGSHSIRDADASWPAPGSRFHHRVGVGPFTLKDHTEVLKNDPPHRLVLHARGRPLGTAKVDLRLESCGDGTRVTMIETAGDPLSRIGINPLTDPLVRLRNAESLRRLRRIAETGVVKS
jgi:uncharacterized protein YndB with AHSA1/START domain